ncbi:hypothetical protein AB0L75_35010 [Streptomyces sp. NPDC052101]|uniref:hypothetical protein n=1 Tax=Streptomyces sp. NPDC052101 TaxID=3155763 RepID=UPI003430D923
MGVRGDLERARRRAGPAARTTVEPVRDETGTVREVRTPALCDLLRRAGGVDRP